MRLDKIESALTIINTLSDLELLELLKRFGDVEVCDGAYVFQTGIDATKPVDETEFDYVDDFPEDIQEYLKSDAKDSYKKFVSNLCLAGFADNIRLSYRGRFYYNGPACTSDEEISMDEIIQEAKVPVNIDNLGMDWIIYPK